MQTTTASVPDGQSRGFQRDARISSAAALSNSSSEFTLRIFEVDPGEGDRMELLRDAMCGAALELAEACVHYFYPRPGATKEEAQSFCDRCSPGMFAPGVRVVHKPECSGRSGYWRMSRR